MKTIIILYLALLLFMSSCYVGIPLTSENAENNQTYEVEYLFEHDGCKVYRFYDRGNYVYFTNCKGDVISIENDSTATRVENHVELIIEKENND